MSQHNNEGKIKIKRAGADWPWLWWYDGWRKSPRF